MKKWIIMITVIGGVIWAVSDFVMSKDTSEGTTSEAEVETTASNSGTEVGLER